MRALTRLRLGVVALVVVLLVPVGIAAVEHEGADRSTAERRQTATDVTFVTTQGGSANVYEHAGELVVVHTESREILRRHDEYRRYMDVDPLGSDRVLVVAGERTGADDFRRIAVVLNWRTGEEVRKFEVPSDTHDIDSLGDGRYVVADKYHPRSESGRTDGRVYVYNATSDEITWEYVFANHYPPYPEAGGRATGYTHLNDVDSIGGGAAFLVSPRNFDRVMAIDRETKRTRWTLGEEDDYDVLHEQHNPVLLQRDPLVVLVADSENDRIVEYRRTDSGQWELVWSYSAGLRWPRDADRLPNGNTLITDSANDRVIEVTPGREVVWEFEIERSTYDSERLEHGDEPAGPPMTQFRDEFSSPTASTAGVSLPGTVLRLRTSYNHLYQLVGVWLLPDFAGPEEFIFVLLATVATIGWLGLETTIRLPFERLDRYVSAPELGPRVYYVASTGLLLIGLSLLWIIVGEGALTGVYVATAFLLVNLGYGLLRSVFPTRETTPAERLDTAIRLGLVVGSVAVCGLLLYSQWNSNGRLLLYGGLGVAVVATATTLLDV
jgi:hypothetical protein